MPKNKSAAIRHRIIDQCINDKRRKYPTLEYLAERCSVLLDTDVSPSTIEKDIAAMKRDHPIGYNAPIVYSKQHKGYAYEEEGFSISSLSLAEEEWDALRFSAQLLFQYREVPVFADFRNAIERINTRFDLGLELQDPDTGRFIQFETAVAGKGNEWINTIFEAIKSRKTVSFTYENIYKKKSATYTLEPLLLREHRNRWYMIGWSEERKDFLTFALDRITSLEKTNIPRSNLTHFEADSFFKHATGIMEGKGKPVKVELQVREPLSKLVLLEPLHHSQKLIAEKEGMVRISMQVYLNEELSLKLLGLGPWCTVLKPASLREQMILLTKQMVKNYK